MHHHSNAWTAAAVQRISRDFCRSADTHIIPLELAGFRCVSMYIKDESTHPTGSLKHRLARSLFLYALCNGWVREGTTVIEASSGSTAVSEAYFARMLGLPFIAVMPRSTSPAKVDLIRFYGGQCHFVDRGDQVYDEATRLARQTGGHYMDQFTYAERATDWRGNNNIAESIFSQLEDELHPVPRWIVTGAGTGGTSATIGRYIRYHGHATQLCVVDPENSVFLDYHRSGDATLSNAESSGVEGIGRPRVEPSFIPGVIDRMLRVRTVDSYAAMRYLARLTGKRYGGSTGTDFYGALRLACEMEKAGEAGSIVFLACDGGDRYLDTYYDDAWVASQGLDLEPHTQRIQKLCETGRWEMQIEPTPCTAEA
ncbi:PLP-dependent cysteine synthase family protein [Diaphorobacter ruginosibacter]|uniref:L-cysteine desulfhydrase Cds1 n=1 Tax=Diaphorobacter ruginosibacter TaxID=1715720 RepID=A0A7G9RPK8_9BURK|nr:PLP-dependent cysteine synthase family protein [Diaphorobacter ruginosibacter]QNN57533.1 PLP-dependent cysteine synthase family protein [Diaphorobacter ruginosibacter]